MLHRPTDAPPNASAATGFFQVLFDATGDPVNICTLPHDGGRGGRHLTSTDREALGRFTEVKDRRGHVCVDSDLPVLVFGVCNDLHSYAEFDVDPPLVLIRRRRYRHADDEDDRQKGTKQLPVCAVEGGILHVAVGRNLDQFEKGYPRRRL
jgi:hypothetical protein